jgi:hypothetical protein
MNVKGGLSRGINEKGEGFGKERILRARKKIKGENKNIMGGKFAQSTLYACMELSQ